jgi:hypothetical protein
VGAEAHCRVRLAYAESNDKATLKRFSDGQIAADASVVTDGLARTTALAGPPRRVRPPPQPAQAQTRRSDRGARVIELLLARTATYHAVLLIDDTKRCRWFRSAQPACTKRVGMQVERSVRHKKHREGQNRSTYTFHFRIYFLPRMRRSNMEGTTAYTSAL